jgi:hypothetical protein
MLRRVMMAGASGPPPTASTFDPSLKGASIVLSNSDRDATKAGAGYQTVYGTQGRSSGRYAFEMLVTARPSVSTILIGFADKTNTAGVLATYLGNNSGPVETVGYNDEASGNSRLFRRMTVGNTAGASGTYPYAAGDVITVDLNFSTNTFAFYKNGTLTSWTGIAFTPGKTYFPAVSLQSGAAVRLITTGLSYLPSGASEWG